MTSRHFRAKSRKIDPKCLAIMSAPILLKALAHLENGLFTSISVQFSYNLGQNKCCQFVKIAVFCTLHTLPLSQPPPPPHIQCSPRKGSWWHLECWSLSTLNGGEGDLMNFLKEKGFFNDKWTHLIGTQTIFVQDCSLHPNATEEV